MAKLSLDQLLQQSASTDGPSFCPPLKLRLGGIDPLGMRQINFDLMDQVFPNLNNVARHIRPFVVVTWAWRRARQIAEATGQKEIEIDALQDFIDRIDVIYVWSQFLLDKSSDLPGSQVLQPLLKMDHYIFGGAEWKKRREVRKDSTALSAAINYGPALKSMGWVLPNAEQPGIFRENPAFEPAMVAFENLIGKHLDHPAFSQFGSVEVTSEEVKEWGRAWSLTDLTKPEREAGLEALTGEWAPVPRRLGVELMEAACRFGQTFDPETVRKFMSGPPSDFTPDEHLKPPFEAWRRVQVRQAFRLAMESLLFWVLRELDAGSKSVAQLVCSFVSQSPRVSATESLSIWFDHVFPENTGPVELINEIKAALKQSNHLILPEVISSAVAFCIKNSSGDADTTERADRLPLWRAKADFTKFADRPPQAFLRHVIEVWILGQHAYWAIGRGLSDARARGKMILRLKIIVEEDGWGLAPGASLSAPPNPTPDRLETALTLVREYGFETGASPS